MLGYLGGVQKGKADLRVERERTHQLREERAEDQLRRRMDAYRDVVNAGTEAARVINQGGASIPYINTKIAELEKEVNGVLVVGATETHEPAKEMVAALRRFDRRTQDGSEFEKARERFTTAAHADVGPTALAADRPTGSIRRRD
jgi:hypothetical protein